MNSPTPPMASFWLLPAKEDEALLLAEIDRLALRHGTPRFHPHLTLLGDLARDPAALTAETRALAAVAAPFSLPIADIVTGEAFYRSFYALFRAGSPLDALRKTAAEMFSAAAEPFLPHVSLLYGPVEPGEKSASAAEVRARLKDQVIRFDRVALTNSANDVPVADWRIVACAPLGGP